MKQVWLIAKRDFFTFMLSPTGFLLLAAYLVISGYVFAADLSTSREASLQYVFSTFGIISILLIPLLTMRLISEEVRTGTFEVLVSAPVQDWQIIVGKFLAGWMSFLMLSAPTFSYLFILEIWGEPDWSMALCGYLGQQLLAILLVALGLCCSAATVNQVLAGMSAMVLGLLWATTHELRYSLPDSFGEWMAYFSIFHHYALFRRGIFDSRAVLFFVIGAGMLLFLAVRLIESRRWKTATVPNAVASLPRYSRLTTMVSALALILLMECVISRFSRGIWSGYNTSLLLASGGLAGFVLWRNRIRVAAALAKKRSGLALIVCANCGLIVAIWFFILYLSYFYYFRLDLTGSKTYEISELTRNVLTRIETPVDIVVTITKPSDLVMKIENLLDDYASRSAWLKRHYIDPAQSPAEMDYWREKLQLSGPLSEEILIASGEKYRRIPQAALVQNKILQVVEGRRILGPAYFVGEIEITSVLLHLTRAQPGKVVFLSGHGEKNPEAAGDAGLSHIVQELQNANWVVQHSIIMPGGNPRFSEDTQVVVIAGPRQAITAEEVNSLRQVLDRGGGILFLPEPGFDADLVSWLDTWNIRLNNDIVADFQSHLAGGDASVLYVHRFDSRHPIGRSMERQAAVLPAARRIGVNLTTPNPSVYATNFMHTSGSGWALEFKESGPLQLDSQRDRKGPISVGVAAERYQSFADPGHDPMQGRMVVIGDSDFCTNQYVELAGNADLFLNCVEWLAGRHDLLSIRPKRAEIFTLALTAKDVKLIYWWSMILLPGAAISAALFLNYKWRKAK
ncbi:MAG: hypothetical protein C4527_16405 [Candidatus Omnitrophota bacterium]|jgi:ABC-2 type transport system permease protein|nr:MAG: hypothetical protein C4527_16405 [Candidatus Omnitrophota bacterium]